MPHSLGIIMLSHCILHRMFTYAIGVHEISPPQHSIECRRYCCCIFLRCLHHANVFPTPPHRSIKCLRHPQLHITLLLLYFSSSSMYTCCIQMEPGSWRMVRDISLILYTYFNWASSCVSIRFAFHLALRFCLYSTIYVLVVLLSLTFNKTTNAHMK